MALIISDGIAKKLTEKHVGHDVHVKTACDANRDEVRIYNKFAKGPQ
ncbi:MAG: hypothetical protein KJ558_10025 [Gammaproteobacteria bacterium]|nr:hypothetical protein [Gammaproteobacteria bacterium]MBU1959685.1 hypothetical protein [Gammaproteobacteria bacterium]